KPESKWPRARWSGFDHCDQGPYTQVSGPAIAFRWSVDQSSFRTWERTLNKGEKNHGKERF
ncbi:hypothetical protein EFP55_11195, partial [Lacticaseibacillus paracasei]|nr:hypothetical protein [Lacticaseibacillus paracasei]